MEFAVVGNQYRPHQRYFTEPGSRERTLYQAEYDAAGRLNLRESGKEDLYGYIQSHRDSVDIHVLLKRFQAGDLDVMQRVQGFYGDVTDMPDTFADVLNLVRRGEEFFQSLPVDERAKYNHSFAEFLAHFDVRTPDDITEVSSDDDVKVVKEVADNDS